MDDVNSGASMGDRGVLVVVGLAAALLSGMAATLWGHFLHPGLDPARDACANTTTMHLTGTLGAHFSGYYLCDGKRIAVAGVLPSTFTNAGVLRCEFRKADVSQVLVLEARDGLSFLHFAAPAGTRGIKADMKDGWSVEVIR